MTLTDVDEVHAMYSLIADLSSQLNTNRQQVTDLTHALESLKGQSIHNNSGYALRRFNLDISKEKFESELEKWNIQLIQENNDLRWENKMNDKLIKEYEHTLSTIMQKFRNFAHSSQVYSLKQTHHYEDLLASQVHALDVRQLEQGTTVLNTLTHLGSLVRSALKEVEGEEEEEQDDDTDLSTAAGPSRLAYGSTDPRWYGSGGYTGKLGNPEAIRSDSALARSIEIQRLKFENEELRRVLDLSEGKGLDVGFGKEKLTLGLPRGKKASSLKEDPPTASSEDSNPHPSSTSTLASDLPAIPSAPLPTSTLSSSHPVPPPAPRASLQDRMNQALESVKRPTPPSPSTSPSSSSSSSSSDDKSSLLVSVPSDSAPAQSDIRSAPILPLITHNSADTDTEQEPRGRSTGSAILDDDEEEEEEKDTTTDVEPVAKDTAADLLGGQEEEATEEVDLNDGDDQNQSVEQEHAQEAIVEEQDNTSDLTEEVSTLEAEPTHEAEPLQEEDGSES
ncbi:unnamed protein product [Sympodiomycopsis kandeliae]